MADNQEHKNTFDHWCSHLTSISQKLQPIGDLVGHLITIGGAISAIVGIALLIFYLHLVGAPLPSLDLATGVALALISAAFAFLFIALSALTLIPALLKVGSAKKEREAFPKLYAGPLWREWRAYSPAYLSYFFPFLVMTIAVWVILFFSQWRQIPTLILQLPFFVLIFAFIALWNWIKKRYNREEVRSAFYLLVMTNFVSCVWVLSLLACIPLLVSEKTQVMAVLIGLFLLALSHFFLTSINEARTIEILLIGTLFYTTCIYPGLSHWGGVALRFIGIGGSLPVSILVKTMNSNDSNDTKVFAKTVSGCLVLNVGSEVLIKPVQHRIDCQLPSATEIPPSIGYDTIERYARTDILKISKFIEQHVTAFTGTWKLNLAKSKFSPDFSLQSRR